jgi:glucose-6-phosphate-specific signal transduction histidine kinase
MKKHRLALLSAAGLTYVAFTFIGFPLFGASVMLPSILLCGFATWLYDYKVGLLFALLSHLINMVMMIHNPGNPEGWRGALEPGGVAAQALTIFLTATIQMQRRKSQKLARIQQKSIRQRKRELEEITEYMLSQSGYIHMQEKLYNIVTCQLTGLLIHSESLRNFLVQANAPQADEAEKLVQIAKQSIEQVQRLGKKLSLQKITGAQIEEAFEELSAYYSDTTHARFTMKISKRLHELPDPTALHLYRIALEVVNNALRHGKATHIDLSLEMGDGTCTLTILNNGTPIKSLNNSGGLGIKTILHRAECIQATPRFETTPDGKTRFTCTTHIPTAPVQETP